MKISVQQLIKDLLKGLPARQRDVVALRYGLNSAKGATLAKIGEKYNITRERVRQLESLALNQVREAGAHTDLASFTAAAVEALKNAGGVKREAELLNDMIAWCGEDEALGRSQTGEAMPVVRNGIRFLLEASGNVFEHRADDHFHTFWHLGPAHKERAAQFIDDLHRSLQGGAAVKAPANIHFVSVSKKFALNPFGEFGLAEWAHIVPKTARDWAYLILKKANEPLHFTEIATRVSDLRSKKTNAQTIHNELIKDKRFVLVGKGTYGLTEHGYESGTAREVLTRLLKKGGPMRSRQVVREVLKQRIFKENTILINLQNKKHFQRLADGRYAVKEA